MSVNKNNFQKYLQFNYSLDFCSLFEKFFALTILYIKLIYIILKKINYILFYNYY